MAEAPELDIHDYLPGGWRRAALVSALRMAVISIVIVGATALTSRLAVSTLLYLVIAVLSSVVWLTLYVIYYRWMAKRIAKSEHPIVPGVEALVVGTVLYISIFAKAYHLLSMGNPQAFSEPLDLFASYYFTITILATVGFGDIVPLGVPSRAFAMVQMLLNLVILAIAVRLVTSEVKKVTVKRKMSTQSAGNDNDSAATVEQ